MPLNTLAKSVLLPELNLINVGFKGRFLSVYQVDKEKRGAVCTRCATFSRTCYDRRRVTVKDAPIRGRAVLLKIEKRRYWCKPCKRAFTEPVDGIMPGMRTTQRYRRGLLWACENYSDLKKVRRTFRCSNDLVYKALYEQLELKRRSRQYPWPRTIGMDEHAFKKAKKYGGTNFVSMIVDHSNKRVMEVAEGKTAQGLYEQLKDIPGADNVKVAAIDMCDPYKNFIRAHFRNADIVADKFHVLRLLTPALLKERRRITGTNANRKARRLLLMSSKSFDYFDRQALLDYLENYPELKELYRWKEALHRLYRVRGYNRARYAMERMLGQMKASPLKEIKRLRKTLEKWKEEILNYFKYRITNARTEGYNNVAKVIKRRSYGFRNFQNYRLRILNACA